LASHGKNFSPVIISLSSSEEAGIEYLPTSVIIGTATSFFNEKTPAAFISMLLPLLIFFGAQKYFVRAILSRALKG
jgi:alpha-glucoside transport system permease protein